MKDTTNLRTKNGRNGPQKKRKNPYRQHLRNAELSRTELRDLIRQNKNKTLKLHRRYASLSRVELRDLIGLNINKGNSCTSVSSQKHKRRHAVRSVYTKRKRKSLGKCIKLLTSEVRDIKNPAKPYILRPKIINSPGHGFPRDHVRQSVSRLLNLSKVRHKTKTIDLKSKIYREVLKRAALSGINMSGNSDEEKEKSKKQHKCLRTASKSSKRRDIDSAAFSVQIERTSNALKRQGSAPLPPEAVMKHLNAIVATVKRIETVKRIGHPRKPNKTSSNVPPPAEPEDHGIEAPKDPAPSGSTIHGTKDKRQLRRKRKRCEVRVKSEPESESSEPNKQQKKRSKRSIVSETEESTSSDEYESPADETEPVTSNESTQSRHRRRQKEIREGKASKDSLIRLKQRSNKLFDHEGIDKDGNKFFRRNPKEKFKPPPQKPGDGKNLKHHPEGKMLKASRICDQHTAGRALRPYLNGVGYQLRLALAMMKLQELALPEVAKPKTIKGKNGKPSQLIIDERLRYALATLRRVKRALDAFDQWKYPEVGAFPVEKDQSKIPYVCLMNDSENETENRKNHPLCWMGTEIPNDKIDRARYLLDMFTYLIPPMNLGNMKGDAKHFDKEGNLIMVKEEVVSEPEPEQPNKESDESDSSDGGGKENTEAVALPGTQASTEIVDPEEIEVTGNRVLESDSDIEIIAEIPKQPKIIGVEDISTEGGVDRIKIEPKSEPVPEVREPTPGTSTEGVSDTPNLETIQAELRRLSALVFHNLNMSDSIIKETQTTKAQANRPLKKEPSDDGPPEEAGEKEQDSDIDTNKCIQILEDHIAATQTASPTPDPQTPDNQEEEPTINKDLLNQLESAVKSSLDRCGEAESDHNETIERLLDEEFQQSSESENQGVEEVGSSSSSQEEVLVDPSNLEPPVDLILVTPMPGPTASNCDQSPSTSTAEVPNSATRKAEQNNNKEKPKSAPAKRKLHKITNKARHQILVHGVPVNFPVAGNLMESDEALRYIRDALEAVSEVNELPGDIIVNATYLKRMENKQPYRATVVVELDSEERCDETIKKAKRKLAQDKNFAYSITQRPKRHHNRNFSYSDDEKEKGKKHSKQNRDTLNASTPKRPREDTENEGPSKRRKEEPENAGPPNAISTPRINPDAPIDALEKLVQGLSGLVPVPRIDGPPPLDTTNMDLAMTVEFENDMYSGLDNTTVPITEAPDSDESVRQECQEREMALIQKVESFRRLHQNWSDDLNLTLRGRPVPQYPSTDLRLTMRRKSGPTDLRNSVLNRDKDIRSMMRPERRTSSVPPNPETDRREPLTTDKAIKYLERTIVKRENFLGIGTVERRHLINRLKRKMKFQARNNPDYERPTESETSSSSGSNEDGEVEPSEDELTNVRFSESETTTRTPKQSPQKDKQKPGPSGTGKLGSPEKPSKNRNKAHSPIKFPGDSPSKNSEDVPLSKLIPDAREKLNARPASSVPKIDGGRGPVESRIWVPTRPNNPNVPTVPAFLPWSEGQEPINNRWLPSTSSHMKWCTPHSSRPFIEGRTTTRDDSTTTDQENGTPRAGRTPQHRPTEEVGRTEAEYEEEDKEAEGVNDPKREDNDQEK